MATKKLLTLNVKKMSGQGHTVKDTVDSPLATSVLESFLRGETMRIETPNHGSGEPIYIVPYHAVASIIVNESNQTVDDRPDPYGC